jgi:hypothetical protein
VSHRQRGFLETAAGRRAAPLRYNPDSKFADTIDSHGSRNFTVVQNERRIMAGALELGPLTEIRLDGKAGSKLELVLRSAWRIGLGVLVILVVFLAWLVAVGDLFKAGDKLGYNLGLAGGIMMLTLLIYPLRKRYHFLDRLGAMLKWFRFHMLFGILGPVLVLFHSTFKIGSMNARVAFYSMLLVAGSGVIGRYLYRHVHRGLYGRQMSLSEIESDLQVASQDINSVFGLAPEVGEKLSAFQAYSTENVSGFGRRIWRFMTLGSQARRVGRQARNRIKRAIKRAAAENRWGRVEAHLHYDLAKDQIANYLSAVCLTAQFATWERLFSLWHVIHVPFIYLLVISGVVHVVAVHMY